MKQRQLQEQTLQEQIDELSEKLNQAYKMELELKVTKQKLESAQKYKELNAELQHQLQTTRLEYQSMVSDSSKWKDSEQVVEQYRQKFQATNAKLQQIQLEADKLSI